MKLSIFFQYSKQNLNQPIYSPVFLICTKFFLAHKGKAHQLLKATTSPRRSKAEIARERQDQEEEKANIMELKRAQEFLTQKGIKAEQVQAIVAHNESLIHYLQEKGFLDENGNPKT